VSGAAAPAAPPAPELRPLRALALVFLASASFSGLSACVKALGPEVGIGPPVFARGAFGLATCLAWALWAGHSLVPTGRLHLAVRCLAGGAALSCYYYAIGREGTELGTAAMLLKTSPLWVALLAPVVVGERPGPRVWLGLALGLGGVATVYGLPAGERTGILLCLGAGVLAAFAYMSLRALARTDGTVTVVLAFSLFLTLAALPFLGGLEAVRAWTPRQWLLLGASGLLGTLGQLFVTAAYRWSQAAAVTIGGLAEVGVAMLLSLTLFGQTPTALAAVGGALAMSAGFVAASGRRRNPPGEGPGEEVDPLVR